MNPLEKEMTIYCDDKIFNTGYGHFIHLDISKHDIELKYAGEPPRGDFYYDMYIDGKRIEGYVWGWTIAFPFKQKYVVCHWMRNLYERKTIIIDIERLEFIEMDRYWTVKDITENHITFTAYEKYADKNSKQLTLSTCEREFKEWLRA